MLVKGLGMGTGWKIRRADLAEADEVAAAFAAATADEVVSKWMMDGRPDIARQWRATHIPQLVRRALIEDEVWVAGVGDDIQAISLWQTVTSAARGARDVAAARQLFEDAPSPPFRRLSAVISATTARHPAVFPHRYLGIIATLPQHRGSGAGGAILADRLAASSLERVPVYLEASTERSARLYSRCGFVREGEPISLPENGPTMVPMWFRG